VIGLVCCWKWATENKRLEKSPAYTGLLRLASGFFAVIVIAEVWGKDTIAFYLFNSVIDSTTVILIFVLFLRLVHGVVEWLFNISALRKAVVLYSDDIDSIVQRTMSFVWIAACGLILLPSLLMVWGVYGNLQKATKGFWNFGFDVGTQRITVGLVIIVIAVLYGSFVVSWSCQKIFLDVLLRKKKVQRGVRLSIERLIHYFVIFVGFLVAISLIGFDMTKFTIILSALGVGIGFGLQGVVNNFVSGLTLLFERPIRQGDIIEVAGIWAEVKNIGLRATTVQTFDQADLIIPNADLTTNQVINWTLSNRQARTIISVGVAYGSDVSRVIEILTACAKDNERVAEKPEPQVLFQEFGESALNFELRVWIIDTNYRLATRSQLHQEIDKRFREANIVIAFPQRDLHIRSIDKSKDTF
jgi:small-conductance mechanosensitive channel